jgi:hypothetical protein
MLVARLNKLLADHVSHIAVDAVYLTKFLRMVYQIKMGRPKIHTRTLEFNTKIPDKVSFPLLLVQSLAMVFIFDPKFVGEYHVELFASALTRIEG